MSGLALFCLLLYTSLQLLANITSIKIGYVLNYAVDMGVFLYPLTFTLRDVIHRSLGKRLTQQCIYCTVAINLFMVLYFCFISHFPADESVVTSKMFDTVFSPVWRVVIASLLAQLVSELIDTEIYQLYVNKFKEKYKWGRVVVSNVVSIPIDNFIFCVGAFAFVYELSVLIEIFLFNIVVKYLLSFIVFPMIYLKKEKDGINRLSPDNVNLQ